MYSNDMWRFHPVNPKKWGQFPLKFWEDGKVKIKDISKKDQEQLTTWATQKSVDFIKRNKNKPFLFDSDSLKNFHKRIFFSIIVFSFFFFSAFYRISYISISSYFDVLSQINFEKKRNKR